MRVPVVKTERENSGMKKRHTEEQIIRILKRAEAGIPVADLLREHNISQGTFLQLFGLLNQNLRELGIDAPVAACRTQIPGSDTHGDL